MIKASKNIQTYFEGISTKVDEAYALAKIAREQGLDPEREVPIPLAKNMAERVVGLISVVCPKIVGSEVTKRIVELEREYGQLDWRVGFVIAEEVAKEKFFPFEDKLEAMQTGIRVGFAYLTLGIVSAPLEGFVGLKIKKRKDGGGEYFALQYAGPIRGAGGTAASTSVILADYVRVKMGYAAYDPTPKEVSRYTAEVHDYHERVTNLQYHPSDDELKFMISNLPIEVDGEPTERIEVSNYKDIERIETNLIRGGMALVMAEGLCQKAPKLWKRLAKWGDELGLGHWKFLGDFLKLKEEIHASHDSHEEEKEETQKVKPNNTFIMDIVAGRPIITHPMAKGGLRLRYGRTRTSGFSAAAMHPATQILLQKYIAIGTQLKVERPGKAATIASCDSIDGPIVLTNEGEVIEVKSTAQAQEIFPETKEVLYLGEILFNYGDFSENGHMLVPVGYCPEWWAKELERKAQEIAIEKIEQERVNELIKNPFTKEPTFKEAVLISKQAEIGLHPKYTYFYKVASAKQVKELRVYLTKSRLKITENGIEKIIIPYSEKNEEAVEVKKTLEEFGIPHAIISKQNIVILKNHARALALALGITSEKAMKETPQELESLEAKDGLEVINALSPIKINDKAGTFIGARMGRPEKAKMRKLTGSPHAMFPVGEEGGRLRSLNESLKSGVITSSFPYFYAPTTKRDSIYALCEETGEECEQKYHSRFHGDVEKKMTRHGEADTHKHRAIDIKYFFKKALERLDMKHYPELIKGVRGTSNKEHVAEHLAKGILRAKHNVHVNKEGTTRYDATEMPITHFKPKEISTTIEKLKELGYTHDKDGNELTSPEQIIELKPQDIVLPGYNSLEESAPIVLTRVCQFVDDLLVKFYKTEPFYNVEKPSDLAGKLVIGLAPHISAGMVGRIIGYSQTQALLAHPMFHAALRRDCDGDEAAIMMLMDALLNFSRRYLPSSRGSTMDAPLVLTNTLDPSEVDDQVHGVDVLWHYPLEFYEAALECKNPWEVRFGENQKITQLSDRIGTEQQYEDFGYTHEVSDINKGVLCSAYKTVPSMVEKLVGQMEIAQRVRAVDMDDVARLVIQKHFLKDIKGNLRKFSMQQFRCVKCNAKYRRPPLRGMCTEKGCHGKLLFTISEGSVVKYLGHSLLLAEKYDFSPYLKQTLDLLKENVDNVFGKEKDKQVGLGNFLS